MSSTMIPPVGPEQPISRFPGSGFFRGLANALRSRIVSGLVLALPIVLTFWIIYQLYLVLNSALIYPAKGVRYLLGLRPGFDPESAWLQWVAPLIAMVLVLALLYILGLFARSWVHRAIDWVLLHVPVVTTIYKAIRNVFESLDNQFQGNSFQRVVLIPYPSEGSKVLGFVTKTLSDATTGQSIACVCVLTGVMPPSGFTVFLSRGQCDRRRLVGQPGPPGDRLGWDHHPKRDPLLTRNRCSTDRPDPRPSWPPDPAPRSERHRDHDSQIISLHESTADSV